MTHIDSSTTLIFEVFILYKYSLYHSTIIIITITISTIIITIFAIKFLWRTDFDVRDIFEDGLISSLAY